MSEEKRLRRENRKLAREIVELEEQMEDVERLINYFREGYHEACNEKKEALAKQKGTIARQEDEIDVLYRKIATLLADRKPEDYASMDMWQKRNTLRKILDEEIEPKRVFYGNGWATYSLRWHTGARSVYDYPTGKLRFE